MYGNGQAPIFILKEGVQRTRGRSAQSNNIAAAKAVADAVRSTLGPKGMDKMLVDSMGDVGIGEAHRRQAEADDVWRAEIADDAAGDESLDDGVALVVVEGDLGPSVRGLAR